MKKFAAILIATLVFCFTAMAAEDANGTWKATIETPQGSMENTFTFKVADGKVTGSITNGMMGTLQISSGSVDGDKIKFAVTSDFGEITYTGTIKGDDMKLTLTAGGGQFTIDLAAKRAKT